MDKNEVAKLMSVHADILKNEYSVARIGIFGSVVKGTMTDDSDLDFVVELSKPIGFKFNSLVEYLEKISGRKVDVLTREGIRNIRVKEVADNIERSLVYV